MTGMVRMAGVDETGDAAAYRPVSRLAVAAVVAGVASSLALTTPMLWALPLVGVGLALAGLADVARAGAEKVGRSLALAGLALSVGFGVQAVTTTVVSRLIVEGRARSVVNTWLDAIRDGRFAVARTIVHGEMIGPEEPISPVPGLAERAEDAARLDAAFRAVPAVAAIEKCGPAAVRDVRCTGRDATETELWGVTLRLAPCAGGKNLEIALQLTPTPVQEGDRRIERWMILKADVMP